MTLPDSLQRTLDAATARAHGQPVDDKGKTAETRQEAAQALEDNTLDMLSEAIGMAQRGDNNARLDMGEPAAMAVRLYGQGILTKIAIEQHIVYKTLAERAEIVEFYSAGQKIVIGESDARDLMVEYPTLQWTHLRDARRLGDRGKAIAGLQKAVKESYTPAQFQKYITEILGKPDKHKWCRSCRFWQKVPGRLGPAWPEDWAECTMVNENEALASANTDATLAHFDTQAKFGCNQWQKKA